MKRRPKDQQVQSLINVSVEAELQTESRDVERSETCYIFLPKCVPAVFFPISVLSTIYSDQVCDLCCKHYPADSIIADDIYFICIS